MRTDKTRPERERPRARAGGFPRLPFHSWEAGGRTTGSIVRNALFHSETLDWLKAQTRNDPARYTLPGPEMLAQVTAAASLQALRFRTPAGGVQNSDGSRTLTLAQPDVLQRWDGVERIDWEPSSTQHLTGRVALLLQSEPDFIWSPYPDFISPLHQNDVSTAFAYLRSFSPALTLELRGGYNRDLLDWDRQHNDLPSLRILPDPQLILPGSPASFTLRNAGNTVEFHGNLLYASGRHEIKGGGGEIARRITGQISVLNGEPALNFPDWTAFATGHPSSALLPSR